MQKLQVVTIKDISLKMLQKSEFTKTSRNKNMYNAKSRKNALIIEVSLLMILQQLI